MIKRLYLLLSVAFLLSALDATAQQGSLESRVDVFLLKNKAAQTKTPDWKLDPIIFPISQNNEQCYALAINAKWLLTHKNCFNPSQKGGRNFNFNLGGKQYPAVLSASAQQEFDFADDPQSGAVLLNMQKITLANGVLFSDFIQKNDGGRFDKGSNYSTIMFMSLTEEEANGWYFKHDLAKATFVTPSLKEPLKVASRNGLLLTMNTQDTNGTLGEPLYFVYERTGNKVLVGFNIAPKGQERKYIIFGVGFTKLVHFTMWKNPSQFIVQSDLSDIILPYPPIE